MNPKYLTLSENAIWCVSTVTDDGKQSEGSEGAETRMASVLSQLSLSWLRHINDFMWYEHVKLNEQYHHTKFDIYYIYGV